MPREDTIPILVGLTENENSMVQIRLPVNDISLLLEGRNWTPHGTRRGRHQKTFERHLVIDASREGMSIVGSFVYVTQWASWI